MEEWKGLANAFFILKGISMKDNGNKINNMEKVLKFGMMELLITEIIQMVSSMDLGLSNDLMEVNTKANSIRM